MRKGIIFAWYNMSGTKTEQPDYFPDERGGCRGEGMHSDCALAEIGTASTPGMPDSRPYV
jgi:hypothetical protein